MSSLLLISSDFLTASRHIKVRALTLDELVFAKTFLDFVRKGGLDTWDSVLDLASMLRDPPPQTEVLLKNGRRVSECPAAPVRDTLSVGRMVRVR